MAVKRGYKLTELGVIPEDWIVRPFLTAVRVASGQVNPGIEPYRSMILVAPDHVESGTGRLLKKETAFDQRAISGKYIFGSGDIVYSKIRPYLRKAIKADFSGLCSADMYPFKPSADVSSGFIFALVLGHQFSKYAESVSVRSGMPKINRVELGGYSIALPPTKAEQEAIAEALSDADALIESLEQFLAKKRQIKQGAMQELLTGKKRLPGFTATTEHKHTEMGIIPEDWGISPLGQLLRRPPTYGINAPSVPYDSRFPTYLRITDITEDGRFDQATKTSVEHSSSLSYLLELGDIVFARTGASVGKSYLYSPKDGRLVFAGFLIRITPDPQHLVPEYFSFFAQSYPYWMWVKINSMRSGQPGINGREYMTLPIPLPLTKTEQEAIAAVLSDMDAEIVTLETKLVKAHQMKQGMMQELLTGRIRLI